MNWWLVILGVLTAIVVFLYYINLLGPVLFVIAIVGLAYLFYKKCVKKLEPFEAALVYRFGRYHRTSPSGWTIVLPWFERMGAVVDMREWQDFIPITVITKEGLRVRLNAVVYSFINNAKKAVLNVQDYRSSLVNLIESRVRDITGDFSFTQLFVNVEDVSKLLQQQLNKSLDIWGITLNMFEIEKIQPPEEVMDAISGVKVAEKNLAAKKFNAEARKVLVNALGEGTQTFDDRTTSYLYIKALENMKSAKMMMPAEFMDVMSPSKAGAKPNGNNLVKGMVAGTTFNKAMGMIGEVVEGEATIPEDQLETLVDHGKEISENEDYLKYQDEAAVGGFDGLDGEYDGTNKEYVNKDD